MNRYSLLCLFSILCSLCTHEIFCDAPRKPNVALLRTFQTHSRTKSDINEHLSAIRSIARKCDSAVEIGVRNMVSTWPILLGLTESRFSKLHYVGIDLVKPPLETLRLAKKLSKQNGISFKFRRANDMKIKIKSADMLFIDSLHTYCHLTYELEKFSPKIRKFIVLHDTSQPWGHNDDTGYHGNYSEYPLSYDRNKRGLWPAVVDFLGRHPEWILYKRYCNNHGLTILQRIGKT